VRRHAPVTTRNTAPSGGDLFGPGGDLFGRRAAAERRAERGTGGVVVLQEASSAAEKTAQRGTGDVLQDASSLGLVVSDEDEASSSASSSPEPLMPPKKQEELSAAEMTRKGGGGRRGGAVAMNPGQLLPTAPPQTTASIPSKRMSLMATASDDSIYREQMTTAGFVGPTESRSWAKRCGPLLMELEVLKPRVLKERAISLGVPQEHLDEALDAHDVKGAIIASILGQERDAAAATDAVSPWRDERLDLKEKVSNCTLY
jgi:hypothetical protein